MGFTLTSTAVVMQILNERGDTNTPEGQRFVSILLLEDLAIVPLLAFVAFLAPGSEGDAGHTLAGRRHRHWRDRRTGCWPDDGFSIRCSASWLMRMPGK